jgi:fatty acid desaturase
MRKVTEVLSREEIAALGRKSNLRAFWTLGTSWGLIALTLAAAARWPNPFTIVVALVILGGRQLGLTVMMHDAAHRSLFRSPALNLWIGRWLCAAPTFAHLDSYFAKHQIHHTSAGSHEDPDLENYRHYAVTKASFRRKVLRDLTGRTGVRNLRAQWRALGREWAWRPLVANVLLLAVLALAGHAWLYLLWAGAWLSTYMLFSRLRQAAEHAVVPDLFHPDPRMHTRTTYARWWERLTIAPNHVNYHLEHHLLPTVPPYRLARMHRTLLERGYYSNADIAADYVDVVGRLTTPAAEPQPRPA